MGPNSRSVNTSRVRLWEGMQKQVFKGLTANKETSTVGVAVMEFGRVTPPQQLEGPWKGNFGKTDRNVSGCLSFPFVPPLPLILRPQVGRKDH